MVGAIARISFCDLASEWAIQSSCPSVVESQWTDQPVEQVSPDGRVHFQVVWSLLAMVVLEVVEAGDVSVRLLLGCVALMGEPVAKAVEEDGSLYRYNFQPSAFSRRSEFVGPVGA